MTGLVRIEYFGSNILVHVLPYQVGGRLGYSIRGTLQSQSKSFVESQHSMRVRQQLLSGLSTLFVE